MRVQDRIRFVRQNMSKTKSRVFMTVLATAMGCAFLIVLASVGFGLQQSIVDQITGDRAVTEISVHTKETDGQYNNEFTDSDLEFLRGVKHVKGVTVEETLRQGLRPVVEGQKQTAGDAVRIMDTKTQAATGFKLSAGRLPENPLEVVIGYDYRSLYAELQSNNDGSTMVQENRDKIPPAQEWVGKTMVLTMDRTKAGGSDGELESRPVEVTIVGVTEKPSREWLRSRHLYITRELLYQIEDYTGTLYGELPYPDQPEEHKPKPNTAERTYWGPTVIADNMKNVKSIAEEIRSQGYLNHSIANELDQVNIVFMIMNIGLIFVGTIAVIIASIGIYNTMTMAVTERAQDIGIMKAIGAHPRAIRSLFLLECAAIGLLGAFIGTVVSYGISIGVNAALPLIISGFMDEKVPDGFLFSRIPYYLTALSVAISLGVAVLSGYRPALRATRVDVLKALRRDI